ncbi:MAG: hypothetical protein RJA81_2151 [Planctomycetota bacterium]
MHEELRKAISWCLRILTATGLVISANGYDSRVIDQCYRLPVMEHMFDQSLYSADPFVLAFDSFNPHVGYLYLIKFLEAAIGLSLALFLIYVLTLAVCIHAIWKIRASLFPNLSSLSDWLLVLMFSLCKAGNIGTNHLWEDHLLDRQIGFTLGWLMLMIWLNSRPSRHLLIAILCGLTAIVHPGLGLLYAALWTGIIACYFLIFEFQYLSLLRWCMLICGCMLPWALLYLPQSAELKAGVDPKLFWELATELQGPQHMRPIHWRATQWYAACLLLIWGGVQAFENRRQLHRDRMIIRLGLWCGLIVTGLLLAVLCIEFFQNLNIALAQPFRLATPLRGMMLVLMLPSLIRALKSPFLLTKSRAIALILSLRSDMALMIMLEIEILVWIFRRITRRSSDSPPSFSESLLSVFLQLGGIYWLWQHDPRESHYLILLGYLVGLAFHLIQRIFRSKNGTLIEIEHVNVGIKRKIRWALYAWTLPVASLVLTNDVTSAIGEAMPLKFLGHRWRIHEIPRSDSEKLGLWIRQNLPRETLILSPPRDKSLRLWSQRSLVANIAGSPYQAAALKIWAERVSNLAMFQKDLSQFAQEWPTRRVEFENQFEKANQEQILRWAQEYQADCLVLPVRQNDLGLAESGWQSIRSEGRLSLWIRQHYGKKR